MHNAEQTLHNSSEKPIAEKKWRQNKHIIIMPTPTFVTCKQCGKKYPKSYSDAAYAKKNYCSQNCYNQSLKKKK
jgi:hypothetical protein